MKCFQWTLYKVTNGFGTYIVQVDVSSSTRGSETSSTSILCECEPRLRICAGSPKPSLLNNVNKEEQKSNVLHICSLKLMFSWENYGKCRNFPLKKHLSKDENKKFAACQEDYFRLMSIIDIFYRLATDHNYDFPLKCWQITYYR